jgi:hypothetical protein
MKAKEIKVGGRYTAKVSGKLTTVRVDAIREITRMSGTNYDGSRKYRDAVVYDVTNLSTGRRTTFRSATKFRGDVKDGPQKRNYVPSKLGDKQFAEDKARTVADVNRDQGREMEEALGPIYDESDNPSNGWRSPGE